MELRDRWFDDFVEGEEFVVGPHLMTEERIISFATEFDPQRFHIDPVAAANSIYGGLIASGWHTGSVLMKLLSSTLGESSLGSPGGDQLRWLAPVRPGDELRLRVTIESVRPSTTKADRGVLIYRNEMLNQNDDIVMAFTSTMFMLRRPDSPPEGA
ncbi:MAG: MaoC family dehydratase [Acidimicrobiales bacterium]